MVKQVYKYTVNMPSGNPFIWYYDENQRTAFGTSKEARYWKKPPEIGDTITYWKSGNYNEITERVFINEEMVFERNDEIENIKQILEQQIKHEVATIENIEKYPQMYQPNAKLFYEGRKQQAEEILAKIISSNLPVSGSNAVNRCNECEKELESGTVFCSVDCRQHYYH